MLRYFHLFPPPCFPSQLAEQAERYEEMKTYMQWVVVNKERLTTEERNLLSVAYKNVVGARRASWRVLHSIEQKETERQNTVKTYRQAVETELSEICSEILNLIDTTLIKHASGPEESVFYYKMKGDYHRYMAEYMSGSKQSDVTEEARQAYTDAMEAARGLNATNPIRLGLALNFSVFYYEIMDLPKQACQLAKTAFDQAVGELEELNEDEYKDATLIMQLLRDNLTLWQSEAGVDQMTMEDDGTAVSEVEGDF